MEFWFSEFHTPDVKHSIRVSRQLYSKQSDYQRIDIFETPEFGRVLTLDGNVMLTERDEFIYDEMIVHVPMAVHKEAKDILVIGAGDGGVVRELTRYGSQQTARIQEIHALLTEHLDRRYTIEELSHRYLLNTSTLKEVFKAVYGLPIATYMKEYRVRRAMELLRESGGSIAAIAAAVGYESQGKFTRAFKDVTGQLPTEYRREHRG